MKQWLKWLAECGLSFKRTDNGEGNAREYDFGHGIKVIKGESGKGSRGGMVEVNGFTTFHGSVKDLVARIMEVLEQAKAAEEAQAAAEAAQEAQEELEQVEQEVAEAVEAADQAMAQVEARIEVLESYIKATYQSMQRTLDNNEWKAYHEQYLDYKMELRQLKKELLQ